MPDRAGKLPAMKGKKENGKCGTEKPDLA